MRVEIKLQILLLVQSEVMLQQELWHALDVKRVTFAPQQVVL